MIPSFEHHPQSGIIYITTDETGAAKRSLPCTVQRVANRRLIIDSPEGIRPSTAVSVEYNDTLFIGEILHCERGPASWVSEVAVEHTLTDLQGLLALRARLLGEPLPQAAEPVAVRSQN